MIGRRRGATETPIRQPLRPRSVPSLAGSNGPATAAAVRWLASVLAVGQFVRV